MTGLEPVHTPDRHVSVRVHPLPSEHEVPSATTGFEHAPVVGSQLPAVWHWSLAVHVTGRDPVHTPDWQTSVCVHALPSLQVVPSAIAGFEHSPVAGLQIPATWHWSEATHVMRLLPLHVPDWQLSTRVQGLPSSQAVPSIAGGVEHTPVEGSQVPTVWH